MWLLVILTSFSPGMQRLPVLDFWFEHMTSPRHSTLIQNVHRPLTPHLEGYQGTHLWQDCTHRKERSTD